MRASNTTSLSSSSNRYNRPSEKGLTCSSYYDHDPKFENELTPQEYEKLTRWNVNHLPLSSPFHPPYIDPLYAPYMKLRQDWGPPISPFKKNPDYPIIDNHPDRLRLGWGVRFRSQADGITMPDFVMGPNQMGYPKPAETYGPFYTDDIYKTYPLAAMVRTPPQDYEKLFGKCRDPRVF